jgi:hypothetical protein
VHVALTVTQLEEHEEVAIGQTGPLLRHQRPLVGIVGPSEQGLGVVHNQLADVHHGVPYAWNRSMMSSDFGEQAAGDIWNPSTLLAAHYPKSLKAFAVGASSACEVDGSVVSLVACSPKSPDTMIVEPGLKR